MSKTLEDIVKDISSNPVVVEMTRRYTNEIALSGFILQKPKIITHSVSGKESCSFILYQVNNTDNGLEYNSFSCITYTKELVDQFKNLNKVILVATDGKMRYSKKVKFFYSQVYNIKTLCELENDLIEVEE